MMRVSKTNAQVSMNTVMPWRKRDVVNVGLGKRLSRPGRPFICKI